MREAIDKLHMTSDKRRNFVKGQLSKATCYRGFTLVELLIVVAVIGILATVLIIAVNPAKQLQKSRDVGRKTALKNIQSALEQYYTDEGSYPTNATCYSTATTGCWSLGSSSLLGANADSYIKLLPGDPSQTPYNTSCSTSSSNWARFFLYQSTGSGTGYVLSTRLENTSDPQITGSVTGCAFHNYQIVNQQ